MNLATSIRNGSLLGALACGVFAWGCEESSSSPAQDPIKPPVVQLPDAGGGGTTDTATRPDFGAMLAGGDCSPVTGPGVEHRGDIGTDEVWRAADSPHRVSSTVRLSATVVVEACAVVVVEANQNIEVGGVAKNGKLILAGTFEGGVLRPVRIKGADESKPSWGAIVVGTTGSAELAYAAISGGDAPTARQNGGGVLRVFGESRQSSSKPSVVSKVVKSNWALVHASGGAGVNLLDYAGFADDSTALAVTGSAADPLIVELGAASALPPIVAFEKNARDAITLTQPRAGTLDVTLKKLGVPYRAESQIVLQPFEEGKVAVLTIEPGVTIKFDDVRGSSGLTVGVSATRQGALVAVGASTDPIVFTSAKATPAKGDWMGISFAETPANANRIDHAVIEYAGANSSTVGRGCGPSDNDSTVLVATNEPPSSAFITNTRFREGAGFAGIVSGWVSDADGPNLLPTNTFENMPECKVTKWKPKTLGCKSSTVPECL